MCFGAAIETGIALVVFGMAAPLDAGTARVSPPSSPESRMPEVRGGVLGPECRALFTEWLAEAESNGADELQIEFVRQTLTSTKD